MNKEVIRTAVRKAIVAALDEETLGQIDGVHLVGGIIYSGEGNNEICVSVAGDDMKEMALVTVKLEVR